MLLKKHIVTDNVDIEYHLSKDLDKLARVLDRPRGELINKAIEKLLIENKLWFLNCVFLDYFEHFLDNCNEGKKIFKFTNVEISVENTGAEYIVNYTNYDGEKVIESSEYNFNLDFEGEKAIEEHLMSYWMYIDRNSEEARKYAELRVTYD